MQGSAILLTISPAPVKTTLIFSLMRIKYKINIDIVKNIYDQQVNGGVAECVTIVGTWFNFCGGFFIFLFSSKQIH
jgi:hypothetical protein